MLKIMENPSKMDALGGFLIFLETPKYSKSILIDFHVFFKRPRRIEKSIDA